MFESLKLNATTHKKPRNTQASSFRSFLPEATGSPAAIERWVRRLCAAQLRPDGATFTTLLREARHRNQPKPVAPAVPVALKRSNSRWWRQSGGFGGLFFWGMAHGFWIFWRKMFQELEMGRSSHRLFGGGGLY